MTVKVAMQVGQAAVDGCSAVVPQCVRMASAVPPDDDRVDPTPAAASRDV
jgi:hypothetical protein